MSEPTFSMSINYPPDFKPRYGYGQPRANYINALFQDKEREQLDFLSTISQYRDFYSDIPVDAEENVPNPRWNQPWFPPLDGASMYAMIASSRPGTYLEIGSGNSTKFAVQAIQDHKLNTMVISVDPHPREEVDNICDKVIRQPLENASGLDDIIKRLEPNDVLFFDGSHRCLQNSDVTAFFIDYLPCVPPGVIIGIHDIFWPVDYPERWIQRYYNEQYILGAFMLGQGSRFPLIFSCAYMGMNFAKKVGQILHESLLSELKSIGKNVVGGSLWFNKLTI